MTPCATNVYRQQRRRRLHFSTNAASAYQVPEAENALIGTGFPFRVFDHIDTYLSSSRNSPRKALAYAIPVPAALDLCYVGCGHLDGFWEFGLAPWDMAAGNLIISEAGGLVGDLTGGEDYMKTGNLIAGTPKVFSQIVQLVDSYRSAGLQA